MSPTQEQKKPSPTSHPKGVFHPLGKSLSECTTPLLSLETPPPHTHTNLLVFMCAPPLWRIHSCWNAQICYQRFMPLCSMLVGDFPNPSASHFPHPNWPPLLFLAFLAEQHLGNAFLICFPTTSISKLKKFQPKKSPLSGLFSSTHQPLSFPF